MNILIEPIITEKMTEKADKLNQYGFIVDKTTNKVEIKKAVEKLYNVTVESVNTMIYGGTRRNRYTKAGMIKGKTKSFKKAIVTLIDGDTIDFFSKYIKSYGSKENETGYTRTEKKNSKHL